AGHHLGADFLRLCGHCCYLVFAVFGQAALEKSTAALAAELSAGRLSDCGTRAGLPGGFTMSGARVFAAFFGPPSSFSTAGMPTSVFWKSFSSSRPAAASVAAASVSSDQRRRLRPSTSL